MDFVLTSDLDWASEDCIVDFLEIAREFSITPTLFVTHESAAVRRASREGRAELGIHPNFLPGSDHGTDAASVMDYVLRLAPMAQAMRAHRFLESSETAILAAERGLTIDSNLCHHLVPGIVGEVLRNGLLRLPVFFEDDVHWTEGYGWQFDSYRAAFFGPGLKILNFHPFFTMLNVPDAAFYRGHKQHIRTLTHEQAVGMRHRGAGARSFLFEAIAAVLEAGHSFVTLGEMAAGLAERLSAAGAGPASSSIGVPA